MDAACWSGWPSWRPRRFQLAVGWQAAPRTRLSSILRPALADLFAYSLVSAATVEAGKTAQDGFAVHRLVQDFSRRGMTEERRGEALPGALGWLGAAFVGDPSDVRSWPVLDPLAPHALAVARCADSAGSAEPTARLFNQFAMLRSTKARFGEAEPLFRRALEIYEASRGPDDPNAASVLCNLANLLSETNRFDEAEPLFRRALVIDEASYGTDHPEVARDLNNLAALFHRTGRSDEG